MPGCSSGGHKEKIILYKSSFDLLTLALILSQKWSKGNNTTGR